MVEKDLKVGYPIGQIGCAFIISVLLFAALVLIFI